MKEQQIMNMATNVKFLSIATVVLMVASVAYGQAERASLAGTVTDNSGAVLPGTIVKVTNEGTNTSVSLETSAAGEYRAVNLIPGSYTIEVEKQGFQRHITKGLVLQVAQEA